MSMNTVEALTMQRDALRERVKQDRARREQETREAYLRGVADGYRAAQRKNGQSPAPTLRSVA